MMLDSSIVLLAFEIVVQYSSMIFLSGRFLVFLGQVITNILCKDKWW